MERRLAAILAADMVGYSRLMAADEAGTIERQKAHPTDLIDPKIAQYGGRIVKTTGDGLLAEFPSVVDAVHCAVEIQGAMPGREAGIPETERIQYRVGINLGDIVIDGADILGDGVNIAARLEGLAEPGGICVSRPVHTQVKDKLNLSFDHLGEKEVKNIAEPVTVFRVALDGRAAALVTPVVRAPTRPAGRSWLRATSAVIVLGIVIGAAVIWWPWGYESKTEAIERPSNLPAIAVMPFFNMSGDTNQDYFSDGITLDLINDLSRISGLFVIARSSVFPYKGQSVTVQQVGRELGVSYVLEGSVHKAGDRVRINAQLIDAATGRDLWADRYDGDLTDVFGLQDKVVQEIVTALAIKLTLGEEEQLRNAQKIDPEAYDMLLRGLEQVRRYTRETNIEARTYFEKAIALDPNYAHARANLAWTYAIEALYSWVDNPDQAIARAEKIAKDALQLDPAVRQVHLTLANIYLSDKRHEESIAACLRAIEIDPNYADAFAQLAFTLNYAGQPDEGLSAIRKAIRLNPREPFIYVRIRGQAHYLMGELDAAIEDFEHVVERNPVALGARLLLAAAYARAGRIADAEWEAQEALNLAPDTNLSQLRQREPYKDSGNLERYIEDLRKSGVPG